MFRTFIILCFLALHPVHVSLMSVEYDKSAESFRVFVKVFFDDFLVDAGINSAAEVLNIDSSDYKTPDRGVIEDYFNKKVLLSVNGRKVLGRVYDMNLTGGELSVNMFFSSGKKIKDVTVKSLIMTDIFSDQANMVILKVNDFEEGVKLTPEKTEQTFKIK